MNEIKEEERLRKLEERVENLDKRLDRMETRLDKMDQELKNLREEIYKLDKKFTVLFLIVIFLIVFLNQDTLKFIFKVLGLIK